MRLWPWTKRKRVEAVGQLMLVRARFDAAQTTPDNRKHWSNADALAADSAASPEVRRTLRNRARYEVANNSYARGIVLTLANDVIGTGARLQMLADSAEANRTIEAEFSRWAKAVGLPEKLRTMRQARAQDGEAFALLFNNGNLDSPVKLDLRLIEADQVTTPNPAMPTANVVDGIVFDEFGNPTEYHVLKEHPGGDKAVLGTQFDRIPAASMIHWFRCDRPGQSRGLPDIRMGVNSTAGAIEKAWNWISEGGPWANQAVLDRKNREVDQGTDQANAAGLPHPRKTPAWRTFSGRFRP